MKKREALERGIRAAFDQWCDDPFVWGQSDCLLSIANIIKEARGYDPAAQFRNRYKTKIGAFRVAREFGGPVGAIEAMADLCGWREIDPEDAKVGDAGVVAASDFSAPSVFGGGVIRDVNLWIGRTPNGICALPTERIGIAWRVK